MVILIYKSAVVTHKQFVQQRVASLERIALEKEVTLNNNADTGQNKMSCTVYTVSQSTFQNPANLTVFTHFQKLTCELKVHTVPDILTLGNSSIVLLVTSKGGAGDAAGVTDWTHFTRLI